MDWQKSDPVPRQRLAEALVEAVPAATALN